jgi:ribosome-associated toxin RatA of RatAB toxin-antitoxin module
MFFIKSDALVTNMSVTNYKKHLPFVRLLQVVLRSSTTFIAELLMVINTYAPIKQPVVGPSGRAV